MSVSFELNDKSAWNCFKSDKSYKKKIAIFYGFSLLTLIPILNFIIAPIFSLIFMGYFLNNAHNRIFKQDSPLPKWSDKKNMVIGFKIFILNLLVGLPFNILCGIVFTPALNTKNTTNILIAITLLLIISLILFLYYSVASLVFCTDFKFKSYFNLKALKIVVKHKLFSSYLTKFCIYGIVSGLVLALVSITIVGILAIPAILFITGAAISDLQAQFLRIVFKIKQGS